ncbi:hypothetical protein U0070_019715 [Myodes glareolus]|uniref:Leucine-rich repeat-containing protein 37 N-terminal domain-containing protein n=1 Tax=Myodes glareolus TaxID=447135 RepID=A0AAW0I264_MYOGA
MDEATSRARGVLVPPASAAAFSQLGLLCTIRVFPNAAGDPGFRTIFKFFWARDAQRAPKACDRKPPLQTWLVKDPSTSPESNPEPEELAVSHQHLTNKPIPPGKQTENILMLNGDQIQAPILPSQFKNTASLAEAADQQLDEILVPPLDSQSSKATTFIVSPKELKKDLAQHRKLAKENADEAPEFLEQGEPDQLETQVQNTENLQQEAPDYFPQLPEEDEPLIQKEDSAHHQLPSEEPSVHPEINGPPPNRNEAQHSNLPNVTVNPLDLERVTSETDKEAQAALGQQQAPAQFPESSELLEPSSTRQEALAEISELLENLGNSGSQLKAPALPTKLPEEISPLVEQEGKPADMEPKITSEPRTEIESSPYEEETPTQTPGPLVETEPFPSQQQQSTEPSEYPEEVESPGIDLESPVQPQEEAEELGSFPTQPEDLSQHPGPLLEDEPSPSEIEQPGQLSESPEEVEFSSGNQPEASVQPAVEQEVPLQTPKSPIENVVETPPIHKVQPDRNEEHHYFLPHAAVRPVDVAITITSEPTKQTESSLTQQESPVHPLEYTEQMEPFLNEENPPAQASGSSGESQFQSQLEIPPQALEYAEEFKPSATEQEQVAQSPEHHETTVLPPGHYQAQHSNLSYVTGQPPDLEITVTENPVAAMGTVYHEATASEEVELSNQQGVLYQSPEPILHHKPLSQQEDTTGISQISEEGKPFPAQQEASEQMQELPEEEVAQLPDLEVTFRTELPKSYKTTVKHVDLELTITPKPSLEDGSVPFPQEDLHQPIDSTEKGGGGGGCRPFVLF